MNYFSPKSVAERYSKARPYFHNLVVEKITYLLKLRQKLEMCLDVACGTGLSTIALTEISDYVVGTDISYEMLRLAPKLSNANYVFSKAENLPFKANTFDLITVGCGVHWFQIEKFLAETFRILKANAWLVLYNNYFISEMHEIDEFKTWFPEVYLKKFPSPPRNRTFEWTDENLNPQGFSIRQQNSFKNSVSFTKENLILYFTTQSNITSAVENKSITYSEAERWLNKELAHFFPNNEIVRTINYANDVKFIQKIDEI